MEDLFAEGVGWAGGATGWGVMTLGGAGAGGGGGADC